MLEKLTLFLQGWLCEDKTEEDKMEEDEMEAVPDFRFISDRNNVMPSSDKQTCCHNVHGRNRFMLCRDALWLQRSVAMMLCGHHIASTMDRE